MGIRPYSRLEQYNLRFTFETFGGEFRWQVLEELLNARAGKMSSIAVANDDDKNQIAIGTGHFCHQFSTVVKSLETVLNDLQEIGVLKIVKWTTKKEPANIFQPRFNQEQYDGSTPQVTVSLMPKRITELKKVAHEKKKNYSPLQGEEV